jgi:hypothetical protein
MKKTMNTIDVAALAKVVGGGISPVLALTMFCAAVSAVGTATGGLALWKDIHRKE